MDRSFGPLLVIAIATMVASTTRAADSVVSVIKPSREPAGRSTLAVPFEGRFTATNVTALDLIAAAYGGVVPLDAEHVTGLPRWTKADRFNVEAKSEEAEPIEDSEDDAALMASFAMVRSMLADRFHLRTHYMSREEPVYAIVQGRNGIRDAMKATARDCDAIGKAGPFAAPPQGVAPAMWVPCGVRVRGDTIVSAGGTLEQLARRLSRQPGVDLTVVDRSGLAGRFDFMLQWAPLQLQPTDRGNPASVNDVGPSLFTAFEEQLGLKLERARGIVQVLVIDRIDRPTAN